MTSTSERDHAEQVYVWTWLPGHTEPVVAGLARVRGGRMEFGYGRSYLARPDAISLYGPEVPLQEGWIEPVGLLTMPGCLRDGSPDAWGRRVIESRMGVDENSLSEIGYMLESGSNRLGANDFQARPTQYESRRDTASLDELHEAARRLQEGRPLSTAAEEALVHGTTIGGARPKVLVDDGDGGQWIAKLSASSDSVFSVVNAEATALELARRAGIDVPESRVTRSLGRDVLLVRRFDRPSDGGRRHVVSGLTMAREDEVSARYVSYPGIFDVLREHGSQPEKVGRDLFDRIVFNMAISNTDDHARNHAAFWDGEHLRLAPAYDLAPGNRSGDTETQAMAFDRDGTRESTFAAAVRAAPVYGLAVPEARERVTRIVDSIHDNWDEAADISRLTRADKDRLWARQILNPATSYGYGSTSHATGASLQKHDTDLAGPDPTRPSRQPRGRTRGTNSTSSKTAGRGEGPGLTS
ncbi:type II toxin-antitoxin system HipA family toxin [Phytoactinopolyspora limicola]|uniref:type II toxin-antitoxin system HipA family toxin n=1 Tax=Phytoactinopolyspora limicola TaxID=2715536 RepID=UPI00140DE41A|nr:HipA domain-containing protein [Phytoactinopolyspora limicola]